ncbi:MAG: Xaa-Pro peptidase family protein [Bacillota bacterium]|jgi:Xaa-Pro dipeptidase
MWVQMQPAYCTRRERLLERLDCQGIKRAVITDPLNILYFTGIRVVPYERLYALVLYQSGDICHFVLPVLDRGVTEEPGIEKVLYEDTMDPVRVLADLVGTGTALGVDTDYFPLSLGERIRDFTGPVHLKDISAAIRSLRLYKDDTEIQLIRTAVSYGDMIFDEIRQEIVAGRTERELLCDIFRAMCNKKGVISDTYVIQILSGERSANPHGHSGDRRFIKGDTVTIDFGVCYSHYWSDLTRTFFLGNANSRLDTIYKTVLEAQVVAIERVKPGVPVREVDLAARNVIRKAGYGDSFLHRTGHGIGLDIHEYPKVHSENNEVLQEGMVFTVEPGIYLPGLGGVRIEDDVVVTRNGAAVLSGFSKGYQEMVISP